MIHITESGKYMTTKQVNLLTVIWQLWKIKSEIIPGYIHGTIIATGVMPNDSHT